MGGRSKVDPTIYNKSDVTSQLMPKKKSSTNSRAVFRFSQAPHIEGLHGAWEFLLVPTRRGVVLFGSIQSISHAVDVKWAREVLSQSFGFWRGKLDNLSQKVVLQTSKNISSFLLKKWVHLEKCETKWQRRFLLNTS